jgi:hypothetical protein
MREDVEREWELEELLRHLEARQLAAPPGDADEGDGEAAPRQEFGLEAEADEAADWRLPLPGSGPLPYEELWSPLGGAAAAAGELPSLGSFAAAPHLLGGEEDWMPGAGSAGDDDGRAATLRQTVWVLLGGGGAGSSDSVAAGLHAVQQLSRDPGLSVHAFLLECPEEGLA